MSCHDVTYPTSSHTSNLGLWSTIVDRYTFRTHLGVGGGCWRGQRRGVRTANNPGAFKTPPRFPIWQWFTSYLVRLLHPSARTHLAARILRGMLSQSYAPVASASSATNLSSPIRLSPYCCVAPSARCVRIGTALSV